MLRILKYFAAFCAAALSLIASLVAFNYYFPPTYEATFQLPDTNAKIIFQLSPMHLYLAEYKRFIVLRREGAPDQRLELFPDTGGYLRTQLYKSREGQFMVKGYFDTASIDTKSHKLSSFQTASADSSIYLGAFDNNNDGKWAFIGATQSPEQKLQAGGAN